MKKHQTGFALIELLVALVLLVGVAAVGYYVYSNRVSSGQTATTSSSTPTTFTAPQVNSTSQLSSALQTLNSAGISGNATDSSQLSTQTSGF